MRVATFAIALLASVPATAEPASVMITGIGRGSCASWLADPDSEAQGSIWVLGFWTGNNYSAALNGQKVSVGSSTDAGGIIGAVNKRCLDDPASRLMSEAAKL